MIQAADRTTPRRAVESRFPTSRLQAVIAAITLAAAPLHAQDRWRVVYRDSVGTISIDTTRIVPTRSDIWRIWERNSSGILSLLELDCSTLRQRLIQYEDYVGPNRVLTLVPATDTTVWLEVPPESRGEAGAKGTCIFLNTRRGEH